MIKPISKISNLRERKFFVEKVKLFTRIIQEVVIKNRISYNNEYELNPKTILALKYFSFILEEEDLILLQKVLKKEPFNDFIKAINCYNKNTKKLDKYIENLSIIKRQKLQKNFKKSTKPKTVDFFCGAGGLSIGFKQAGFLTNFANDYEDVCIETFKYNNPEIPENRIILGDIKKLSENFDKYDFSGIDVVMGGPPCQGFSSANQQRIIDDPRNELYQYFIKAVEFIKPKFVVMENVKGMLSVANQVIEDYNNINVKIKDKNQNYLVDCKVLVSDDFGVAQKRQRLFFIAIRSDIAIKKNITPLSIFENIKQNNKKNKRHILADALEFIKPLDSPRIKNMTEVDDELTGKKVDVNNFKGNENSYLKLINQNKEIDLVFNHKARYANDVNYEIYGKLKQGEDGTAESIKHIMPYKHRNHVFKDKYFKLIANKPSRTITAHLKMDCHSHIHPTQIRSITPREAARIQSFPDDYVFLGPYLKTYMQIGNAVPPIMAKGIAKEIKKYL